MQIVINIDKQMYNQIVNENGIDTMLIPYKEIIKNGTPLPEGHGNLIDADALVDTLGCSDRDEYTRACIEEDAPILIEANRSV